MFILDAMVDSTPPPPIPRKPRSQAERSRTTREHLIATAIDVVREHSYQGATVFEVAKAAGVTPGALQHHFGSKAVLMMRVIDEILRSGLGNGVPWPDAALPLADRAHRYVRALWEVVYEPPRFLTAWNVYFGATADPELRDYIASRRADLVVVLRGRFRSVFPELAQAPDVDALADLVLSSLRGLGVVRLFGPAEAQCAAQLDALAELIALRCRAALPTPSSRPGRKPR